MPGKPKVSHRLQRHDPRNVWIVFDEPNSGAEAEQNHDGQGRNKERIQSTNQQG